MFNISVLFHFRSGSSLNQNTKNEEQIETNKVNVDTINITLHTE